MRRKWIIFLSLFLAICSPAAAEDQLDLSVHVPLEGTMKFNNWMRLEVTVTSGEEPIDGYLELGHTVHAPNREVVFRRKLTVGSREIRKLHLDLPTELVMNNRELRVIQGDQILDTELVPRLEARGERVVGVVHENESAFHFLTINNGTTMQGPPFLVHHLEPDSLPTESWIYKNLDLLALGSGQIAKLSDAQVAAIKEWVKRGGVVILTAGPHQHEVVKPFMDLLTLPAGESGVKSDLAELKTHTDSASIPFAHIPVYSQNLPLYLSKTVGSGAILFANYDVTAEPLASWQHNRQVWQSVLTKHRVFDVLVQRDERPPTDRSLMELSKYIPGVATPSVTWIMCFWLAYLLLVAPGLYWLLKRSKRQQWAWGLVPAAALLFSAGVYGIGKPLVVKEDSSFHVSAVRILDDSLAEVQTATSFLSVAGGSYQVVAEPGSLSIPYSLLRGSTTVDKYTSVQESGKHHVLSFEHVPYLSMRQAIANGLRNDAGSYKTNLRIAGDRLQGTIQNHTAFDLEQVRIELGLQHIPVGGVKRGEVKHVDMKIEPVFLSAAEQERSMSQLSLEEKTARLKQNALGAYVGNQIRIVGVSDKPLPTLTLRVDHQAHYWNVVSQSIRLQPAPDGTVVYPYGLLPVHVWNTDGTLEGRSPMLWELSKGSVTFGLPVDQIREDIKRITVPLDHSSYRPFKREVFHAKSGRWQVLPREARLELTGKISEYINRDGVLLLRFTNTADQRISLPAPFFQVEGEEKKS